MTFGIQPYPEKSNSEVYHFVRSGGHPDEPTNSIREMQVLSLENKFKSLNFILFSLQIFTDEKMLEYRLS